MAWLICTAGDIKGVCVEMIEEKYILGRAKDCDIQLTDIKSSRWHCQVGQESSSGIATDLIGKVTYFLEDMGSTNGVRYKGKRFRGKKVKLKFNEDFAIGSTQFRLVSKIPSGMTPSIPAR